MASMRAQLRNRCGIKGKKTTHNTSSTYALGIDKFCDWAYAHGYNKTKQLFQDNQNIIQQYADYLISLEKYTPSTIHTYLSPVCKALNVNMLNIKKPKRSAIQITKGRIPSANPQGKSEIYNPTYKPTVDMSRATGFRRNELKKIRIGMLGTDEAGQMAIYLHGKAGKYQGQRILPADQELVKTIFETARRSAVASGITDPQEIDNMRIFHPKQLANHINYHAFRREQGLRAYEYYAEISSTEEGRKQLINQLVDRWNAHHSATPPPDKKGRKRHNELIIDAGGVWQAADSRSTNTVDFLHTLYLPGQYHAQKANKARLIAAGLSTVYDRVALRCVSVFHLAHWRDDVTIADYFI